MVETSNRQNQEKLKPAGIVDYNNNKAGVDRHDQMCSYYPLHRKTVKWWKKVFFQLFMLGIINSQKYYNIKNNTNIRLSNYLIEVANLLAVPEPVVPPTAVLESRRLRDGNHFPERLPPTEHKQNPTSRCVLCCTKRDDNGKKIRRESSWKCMECDVPLCIECFYPYHRPR